MVRLHCQCRVDPDRRHSRTWLLRNSAANPTVLRLTCCRKHSNTASAASISKDPSRPSGTGSEGAEAIQATRPVSPSSRTTGNTLAGGGTGSLSMGERRAGGRQGRARAGARARDRGAGNRAYGLVVKASFDCLPLEHVHMCKCGPRACIHRRSPNQHHCSDAVHLGDDVIKRLCNCIEIFDTEGLPFKSVP